MTEPLVEPGVPEGMQVQLARLFGSASREAKASTRSAAQWRNTLGRVAGELERYIYANVNTDDLHFFLLLTCILAARESLKEDNFIIGYTEAITRLALLLMGDYPDHRRRGKGVRRSDHYQLRRRRTLVYSQDQDQKVHNLIAASRIGYPGGSPDPFAALREFRLKYPKGNNRRFLLWFRQEHPEIYAGVF